MSRDGYEHSRKREQQKEQSPEVDFGKQQGGLVSGAVRRPGLRGHSEDYGRDSELGAAGGF